MMLERQKGGGDDDLGLGGKDYGGEVKDSEDDGGEGGGWVANEDIKLLPDLGYNGHHTDDGYWLLRDVPGVTTG